MSGFENIHSRGIITSPKLESQSAVDQWVNAGRWDDFVPAEKGRGAVALLGEESPDLGQFNHLNKDGDGNDKEIDWGRPIRLSQINQVYGIRPHDDGFVAIINADFLHDTVKPVGSAECGCGPGCACHQSTEAPIAATDSKGG